MFTYYKRTYAQINVDRLRENYRILKSLTAPGTEIMAVVKANAYGHDDSTVAPVLEECGVKYFAVSNISEAVRLRDYGIKGEILILGYTSPEVADELIRYDIISALVSKEHAEALSNAAKAPIRCHAALDTGMGRIGLKCGSAEEYADELTEISKLPNISLEGMFTHFAVADSGNPDDEAYTHKQQELFFAANDALKAKGITLRHCHTLNSAGGIDYTDPRNTLVRFGILLYGLHPDITFKMPAGLRPVMELKAEISHVKVVNAGDYVSYGRTFRAQSKMKIATITTGYADGYPRLLSSIGDVIINGHRARIVGRVCMDQMMVNADGIDVKTGDIATLFGEEITADMLAAQYGTIGYEIVCGISKRVPRVITDGDRIIRVTEY